MHAHGGAESCMQSRPESKTASQIEDCGPEMKTAQHLDDIYEVVHRRVLLEQEVAIMDLVLLQSDDTDVGYAAAHQRIMQQQDAVILVRKYKATRIGVPKHKELAVGRAGVVFTYRPAGCG